MGAVDPAHLFRPESPRREKLHRAHLAPFAAHRRGVRPIPYLQSALRAAGLDVRRGTWETVLRALTAARLPSWAREHVADRGGPVPRWVVPWRFGGSVATGPVAPERVLGVVPRLDGEGVCWLARPGEPVQALALPFVAVALAVSVTREAPLELALAVETARRLAAAGDEALRDAAAMYAVCPAALGTYAGSLIGLQGPELSAPRLDALTGGLVGIAQAPDPPLTAPRGRARR